MDSSSTATNWSVLSVGHSEAHWQLGVPNNGVETAAHSPPNCWGSCLHEDSFDTIDTSLCSPAIELTGGNVATLQFWHQYDFSERTSFDYRELGQLYLYTNSLSSSPLLLLRRGHDVSEGEFGLSSTGWVKEKIDLTPYVGRVVFLVWHHQLAAGQSTIRAGWLVDDVSVVLSNVAPVTIEVTNNLAQARFTLSGPISRTGQGFRTIVTNAPPGTYTVSFNPVPYYKTPRSQTNTLPAGASLVVHGDYLIVDTNGNCLPDAWEQQYWGTNGSNHNCYTDGDSDGFTDLAEFLAGTNPTLGSSRLRVLGISADTHGVTLIWPSVAGRDYQVQGTPDFVNWLPLTAWTQASTGLTSVTLPLPTTGPPRFYRIEVHP
jgi:hypothetical protein